jgi:hypothetical protein
VKVPELITDTLLVIENFTHDGVRYVAGDRVPTRHRAIRRIAASSPQFFAMEYSTEPLDLHWLASLEAEAEERYEAVKRLREAEKGQRERALRQELKDQERGQPELERRFKEQEKARKRREREAREERERDALEQQVPLTTSGFNL